MVFNEQDIKRLVIWIGGGLLVRWLWENSAYNLDRQIETQPHEARWSAVQTLPAGKAGVIRTLEIMAALVRKSVHDPAIRDFTLRLVQSCPGHGFDCEINAVFNYVRDHVRYRRDPVTVERLTDARRILERPNLGYDCDEKVVVLASMLASIGHLTRLLVCGFAPDDYSHVFLQALAPRGWVTLDPTPETSTVGWQADAPFTAVYPIFHRG